MKSNEMVDAKESAYFCDFTDKEFSCRKSEEASIKKTKED